MPLVLCGEYALNHVLTRAGIPESYREKAGKQAGERKWFVRHGFEHLKMFRVLLNETGQVSRVTQRENRNEKTCKQQNNDLHEIGPCGWFQSRINRVETRSEGEENDVDNDRGNGDACESNGWNDIS